LGEKRKSRRGAGRRERGDNVLTMNLQKKKEGALTKGTKAIQGNMLSSREENFWGRGECMGKKDS